MLTSALGKTTQLEPQDLIERWTSLSERPAGRRWRRLALLIVVGVGMSRNALGIEWSSGGVRWAMAEAGVWAPILFTVLPVFRLFLVIPSVILLPAGGLLFGGAVEGAIYGTIGPTISGLLNSLLAFCFRMTRTRRDTMRCHPSHKQVRLIALVREVLPRSRD